LKQPGDKRWSVPFNFRPDIFARFLAKLAHCFAVAQFGVNGFKHALPPIILGTDKNAGWLVGGGIPPAKIPELPAGRTSLPDAHELRFAIYGDEHHDLLVAEMRLCTFTGAPGYRVVVGEPTQKTIDAIDSDAPSTL